MATFRVLVSCEVEAADADAARRAVYEAIVGDGLLDVRTETPVLIATTPEVGVLCQAIVVTPAG
jgi:hypothetical protein